MSKTYQIIRMIMFIEIGTVIAQKIPKPLGLKESPPSDYSTEVLIGCIVCGLLVFIGIIFLNMFCGGSL